jgi:hypothetical protein
MNFILTDLFWLSKSLITLFKRCGDIKVDITVVFTGRKVNSENSDELFNIGGLGKS